MDEKCEPVRLTNGKDLQVCPLLDSRKSAPSGNILYPHSGSAEGVGGS